MYTIKHIAWPISQIDIKLRKEILSNLDIASTNDTPLWRVPNFGKEVRGFGQCKSQTDPLTTHPVIISERSQKQR